LDATDVDYPQPLTHNPLQQRHLSPLSRICHNCQENITCHHSLATTTLKRFITNAPPFPSQRYTVSPPTLKHSSKQIAMPTSAEISKKVTSVSPPFHPTLHDFTQK